MKNKPLALALLIPLLGIAAFVGVAEVRVRAGTRWLIPIAGYDPRDLLAGHYLTFRYDWEKLDAGAAGCRSDERVSCHVCLEPGDQGPEGGRFAPSALRAQTTEQARECTSWMNAADAFSQQRYYIPEGEGARLEALIREREASAVISLARDGKAQVVDLFIDGKPWREAAR